MPPLKGWTKMSNHPPATDTDYWMEETTLTKLSAVWLENASERPSKPFE